MRPFRHLMIAAVGALALAGCSQKNATITDEDMSIGQANAPVTVVEYASVACPGCAAFNNQNWADIKKTYIDTGKARWVVKEMLTHNAAWSATGFLAARCMGKDKYFEAIDALYHAQPKIDASGDVKAGIKEAMRSVGMSDAQFEACVSNEEALVKLDQRIEKSATEDKITGTPTFFINGKEFTQEPTLANIGAAIEAAAKAKAG